MSHILRYFIMLYYSYVLAGFTQNLARCQILNKFLTLSPPPGGKPREECWRAPTIVQRRGALQNRQPIKILRLIHEPITIGAFSLPWLHRGKQLPWRHEHDRPARSAISEESSIDVRRG